MPDFEYGQLPSASFSGQAVPHQLLHLQQPRGLAVVFPGLHYSADMPLLYYATQVLLDHRIDVLQLTVNYASGEHLYAQDRLQAQIADARSLVEAGLHYRNYDQLVLVGKSIGTLTMALLVNEIPAATTALTIWQTPLLQQPMLVEAALQYKAPALFLVGTADSTYQPEAAERLKQVQGNQVLAIKGANHSLEIPGDVWRSLQAMQQVVQATSDFLDRSLADSQARNQA